MQVLDILTWWKFKYGTYSINSYISPPLSSTKGEVALAILKYMQVFITWSYIFITTYKHKSIARFLGSIMAIQHLLHVQDCTCFSLHVLTSKSFLPFVFVEKKGRVQASQHLPWASNLSPPMSLPKRRRGTNDLDFYINY